jgi:hypothetical protein
MKGCNFDYFVGQWKVNWTNNDKLESAGHIVEISGSPDLVTITCQNGHTPAYEGDYDEPTGSLNGEGWTVTCDTSAAPKKNIKFEKGNAEPGSWTADDSGGDPGGEEREPARWQP